jgi:hypothetical protein
MDKNDLVFEVIPSNHDPKIGASVGVRVHCISLDITVKSTNEKTQYANKLAAMDKLKKLANPRIC